MPPIPAAFFRKGEKEMIHQYKLGGYNIVLDVCSGSVHVVDEVAYDIIAEFENKEKDVIVAQMLKKYASNEVSKECNRFSCALI